MAGIAGHFRNYFGSQAVAALIAFVALPVYSHLLEPREYGVVAVFSTVVALLAVLLPANAHAAIGRYYFENQKDLPDLVGTAAILAGGLLTITTLGTAPWWDDLATVLSLPVDLIPWMGLLAALRIVQSFHDQIYQATKASLQVAATDLARVFGEVGIGITLIVLLASDRYRGPVWAQTIAASGLAVFFAIKLGPHFRLRFTRAHVKYLVAFAIPLIPYQLGSLILGAADRLMIAAMLGTEETGVYALSYSFGASIGLVISALERAWVPYYYELMNSRAYGEHDRRLALLVRGVTVVALVVCVLGSEVAQPFIGAGYHHGLQLVGVVGLGYVYFAVAKIYTRNFAFAKRTLFSSYAVGAAAIANIILNWFLLPVMGIAAAAYSTLASYAMMFAAGWAVNHFIVRVHAPGIRGWGGPVLVVTFAVIGSLLVDACDLGDALRVTAKVGIVLVALPFAGGYAILGWWRRRSQG